MIVIEGLPGLTSASIAAVIVHTLLCTVSIVLCTFVDVVTGYSIVV